MLKPYNEGLTLSIPLSPEVILRLEAILDGKVFCHQEVTNFVCDLRMELLLDVDGKPVSHFQVCQYILTRDVFYLEGFLAREIVREAKLRDSQTKSLCEKHALSSGLALYLLTEIDDNYRKNPYDSWRKAADLKCANAIENLYDVFFHRPKVDILLFGNSSKASSEILSNNEALNYLKQAAELGSKRASLELYRAYLGRGLILKPKVNAQFAYQTLLRALPSLDGGVEYELSLLLNYGLHTRDGQTIPADPKRALELLHIAHKKNENMALYRINDLELYKRHATFVPESVQEALSRIKSKTPQKYDAKFLKIYIYQLHNAAHLFHLLALLITERIIYLPPLAFAALSEKIALLKKDGLIDTVESFSLTRFANMSPLIESLVYPGSLHSIEINSPHAEYLLSTIFLEGGTATMEKIGDYLFNLEKKITVTANERHAAYFLQRAAEHGHVEAQYHLGVKHLRCRRIEPGESWLREACNQHHVPAMLSLADHYWSIFTNNPGDRKTGALAIHYYSLALENDAEIKDEFELKKNQLSEIINKKIDSETTVEEDERIPLLSMPSPNRVRY